MGDVRREAAERGGFGESALLCVVLSGDVSGTFGFCLEGGLGLGGYGYIGGVREVCG